MKPEEKRVRGRIILAYVRYLKHKKGKLGIEAAERDLGIKFSEIMKDRWYPNSHSDRLLSWISETYGLAEVRKTGNFMVSEMGVISAAARAEGLGKVLQSIHEARENSNFGGLEISEQPWGLKVKVREFCVDESTSEAWLGILEGCLKLTNVSGSVEKASFTEKGGGSCTYRMKLSE